MQDYVVHFIKSQAWPLKKENNSPTHEDQGIIQQKLVFSKHLEINQDISKDFVISCVSMDLFSVFECYYFPVLLVTSKCRMLSKQC